jgi:colanic acid/amylovoran biosynthesis protein
LSIDSTSKPLKKAVIFNVFGHLNSGDAVLLETLIDVFSQFRADYSLSGIAFDTASEKLWLPELEWFERIGNATSKGIPGRLVQIVRLAVAIVIALNARLLWLKCLLPESQRRAVEELAAAELAIACPGGYLEDSNSAYVVNIISVLLASSLSKRVVLAPQSIGPIRSRFGRFLVRQMIRRAAAVFVREEESLLFLQEVLAPARREQDLAKVELVGDLAFWFRGVASNKSVADEAERVGLDPDRKILGMTVVDWKFPHVEDRQRSYDNYVESVSSLIRHVEARGEHQIILFNQVSSDLDLGRRIGLLHPQVLIDTLDRPAGTFSKLVGLCDVFVGTRFHSCIFALIENVPTTAIAYLPKTTGIMRALGMEEFVIDIDSVTGDSLIKKYDMMCQRRNEMRRSAGDQVATYRSSHDGFIRYIKGD